MDKCNGSLLTQEMAQLISEYESLFVVSNITAVAKRERASKNLSTDLDRQRKIGDKRRKIWTGA